MPREIAGLALVGAVLAVPLVIKAIWREADASTVWAFSCTTGGLVLTLVVLGAVFMMVIGPLLGLAGGLAGGALAADHPRRSRPDRSWAAGLFVLVRYG